MSVDTAILDAPVISEITELDNNNNELYAHWVDQDLAYRAKLRGRPTTALCGKVWNPKMDAEEYPICPKCQEIYEEIARSENAGG